MKPERIWNATLGELQLQIDQRTFGKIRHSQLLEYNNGTLVVGVLDERAKSLLENELAPALNRTIIRLVGKPIHITYVVSEEIAPPEPPPEPRPGKIAVEMIEFDPIQRGFVQPTNYAIQFWQPYLAVVEREISARTDSVAFNLWLTLSSFAYDADRETWPSIQTLANICAKSSRHAILGRAARKGRQPVIGALEILQRERVVWYRSLGEGGQTSYFFRVLKTLPLLTPQQIQKLNQRVQDSHSRWLKKCDFDREKWDQLTLPSLVKAMSGT
jgi:hypothetical protein